MYTHEQDFFWRCLCIFCFGIYWTISGQNVSDAKWMIILHYAPIVAVDLHVLQLTLFQTVSEVPATIVFDEFYYSEVKRNDKNKSQGSILEQ